MFRQKYGNVSQLSYNKFLELGIYLGFEHLEFAVCGFAAF